MTKPKLIFAFIIGFISTYSFSQIDSTVQSKINYYISQAKFDSAKVYINKNRKETRKKEARDLLNYELVKVNFLQANYNDALKVAFNAIDEIDNKTERVKFDLMIACIYSAISDYNESIKYFDAVIENSKNPSLTLKAHILLSELHLNLKDSISANKSISEAYKITNLKKSNNPIARHISIQYNYLNKNFQLCKDQNRLIIEDSTSFISSIGYANSMIGDCLVEQDSFSESVNYFDKFLNIALESKDPELVKIAANKLIHAHEKLGNQEKANTYHKIHNEAVNDTLSFSIEKYRKLRDFENSREQTIIKDRKFKNYLYLGFALLGFILFGVYYYFKNEKFKKKVLKAIGKPQNQKININNAEIDKIKSAIDILKKEQLFLKSNITRKSFCLKHKIKSERYLSHYINEKYNKSFSVFINELRIEYAYNRIQNDSKFRNFKIEEIAKDSGFGSKKSFERVFTAKYNETPFKLISKLNN